MAAHNDTPLAEVADDVLAGVFGGCTAELPIVGCIYLND